MYPIKSENNNDNTPLNVKQSASQKILFSLLSQLNNGFITIVDGRNEYCFGNKASSDVSAEICIHDSKAYRRIVLGGSLGVAEAFVEGLWSTPELSLVIQLFSRNLAILGQQDKRFGWLLNGVSRIKHRLKRNSKLGSRTNIAAHYDLSNTMYELFLDPHMQYSSAIFPSQNASLEQAQEYKMQLLCKRLALKPSDHLLEVGTGWGGLACYAAKHFGCKVTTTTISEAQYKIAQQRVAEHGLKEQVTLLLDDYRDLTGQYTKIVSVEMIEAVGHDYMADYFGKLDSLLKPGGKLVLQAITIEDHRYEFYRKNIDFIRCYIFPGGHLPAVSEICRHIKEQTTMRLHQFSDYAEHYANTLKIWNQRFLNHSDEIQALGFNDDFLRLWQYYFNYCEGAFRENVIGLAHLEFIKSEHVK